MASHIRRTCLGCLTGALLAMAQPQDALSCEAHAGHTLQTATTKTASQGPVMAMDAWVPVAPPGVKAHAAYLVLMNHGAGLRAVTAVHSPQYASAAIHASQVKDSVNVMQHLAQVEIPVGTFVAFKPHGLHIMLMGPKKPMALGDRIDLFLTLDDAPVVAVKAQVRKRGATAPMNHDHMDHGHKGS